MPADCFKEELEKKNRQFVAVKSSRTNANLSYGAFCCAQDFDVIKAVRHAEAVMYYNKQNYSLTHPDRRR